jgi:poly(3-hydroxybutyrate) depolymerase
VARPWFLILLAILACPAPCGARQEYEITIETSLGDTTETFWLQIPTTYLSSVPCPILIGWHQLGGGWREMRDATSFDDECDARGWLCAAMGGPTPTHWNNQAAQSHMVDMIRWIEEQYAVDPDRIYMVGASMGGAAGMVFSNNHLDPDGPMVAAAASISGIQDCDRRFHEQGFNHSMVGAFGGTPEQVPFAYHRNSAIVFGDSARSMHINARHLPLYLTFGKGSSDSIWRAHAEDLHAVMAGFADAVELRESANDGHGWVCAEESRICDFLGSFILDRSPDRISIRADEEGRWYWADLKMRGSTDSFARLDASFDATGSRVDVDCLANVAEVSLDLATLGFPLDERFACRWEIADAGPSVLSFKDVDAAPAAILRNGEPFGGWDYDALARLLRLESSGSGLYTVIFDPASAPEEEVSPIRVWQAEDGSVRYLITPHGVVDWRLYDMIGRLVGRGEAGDGRIAFGDRLATGRYEIRLDRRTPIARPVTRGIVILH